jgi:mRNA degradation ribonuclease J1/J2
LKYDIERVLSSYTQAELSDKAQDIKRKIFNTVRSSVWKQIRKNPLIGCNIV